MNLPGLSVKRPVAVIMAILLVMLIGFFSLSELKPDLFPDLNLPVAVVTAKFAGAGPAEVESMVTKPFEKALATVSNLKSLQTISTNEYSLSILYFNDGTNMNFATLEMREKIDMVKAVLPQDVSDIMVMQVDPNNFQSAFELGISSDMDLTELTRLVEGQILNRLERINGVASVLISGGASRKVKVELIPERINKYGINETLISKYLMAENLNIPAGNIEVSGMSIFVKTKGELETIEDINNLIIPIPTGGIVYLKDIANVSLAEGTNTSESYINGKLSINLSIQKQSGANTVMVCRSVKEEVEGLKKDWPDINFSILYDASQYIDRSLKTVKNSAIQGGILAGIILFLFLRDLRTTLIIALSMPVSIVASFVLMHLSGITLNLISLAGFALGVGMLVDNSIVVLENIYRYKNEGRSIREASEIGAREVMLAISASTFTTIAVFIPIIYVEGLAGKIFKEMGLIMTYSLLSSLIVSITFIPMVASRILKADEKEREIKRKHLLSRLFGIWERFFSRLRQCYERFLKICVERKTVVIFMVLVVFCLSLIALPYVGYEFFPEMDEGIIEIEVVLPKGSSLKESSDMAFWVYDRVKGIPEVKDIIIDLGNSGFALDQHSTEKAVVTVNVGRVNERRRKIKAISNEIRKLTQDITGAKLKISDNSRVMGFSIADKKVEILVSGEEMGQLKKISGDIAGKISSIKGLRDIETSIDQEITEASIKIDRNKAAFYGLSSAEVGQSIRAKVNGIIASRYKFRGSEINIEIGSSEGYAKSLQDIKAITIQSPTGATVPLTEIAEITLEKSPYNIIRNNQKRTVSITADIYGRALNEITRDIDKILGKYPFPAGYSYSYGGQQKDLFESFDGLTDALILSVIIVYMLLAAQFESLLHPFTILLSVPLSLTGAIASLMIAGKTLSVPAYIGIILLVGIVVDNAIVLIDCINRLRQEGKSLKEAVYTAGPLRLRPILMTTLTTILGMLPMALDKGEGSEILVPLAVVVIGGLSISTLVTLIIIPSFYTAFEEVRERLKANRATNMAQQHIK
ncbi:MAG: efflux RND transporter permease subunit [Clostridiaceae bacterium]|nr:efflux RND transporter permease subunit [Clostridiaceae bacterium]